MNKQEAEMAIRVINHYKSESNTPHIIAGCEFAISSLEKQIPQTVFDNTYCSKCGTYLGLREGENYCCHCGQKLDWSGGDAERD